MKNIRLKGEFNIRNIAPKVQGDIVFSANSILKLIKSDVILEDYIVLDSYLYNSERSGWDIIDFNDEQGEVYSIFDLGNTMLRMVYGLEIGNDIKLDKPIWLIKDGYYKDVNDKVIAGLRLEIPYLQDWKHDSDILEIDFHEPISLHICHSYTIILMGLISYLMGQSTYIKYGEIKFKQDGNISRCLSFNLYDSFATGGIVWEEQKLYEANLAELGVQYDRKAFTPELMLYSIEDIGGVKNLQKMVAKLLESVKEDIHTFLLDRITEPKYHQTLNNIHIHYNCECLSNILKKIAGKQLDSSRMPSQDWSDNAKLFYGNYISFSNLFKDENHFLKWLGIMKEWRDNRTGHFFREHFDRGLGLSDQKILLHSNIVFSIIFSIFLIKDILDLPDKDLAKITLNDAFIEAKKAINPVALSQFLLPIEEV